MKIVSTLLLILFTASCASKNQLRAVAGPFKNEGDASLALYVNAIENDGDSIDLDFTIKNNYPFPVQVPPNSLSITFDGRHSNKILESHDSWVLQPNETASAIMVYEFEPAVAHKGTLNFKLAGVSVAQDIKYSNTKGKVNTVEVGHVYTKHGSATAVGVSNSKIDTSTVEAKSGTQLPPVMGNIEI